jgi:hypothetical protein
LKTNVPKNCFIMNNNLIPVAKRKFIIGIANLAFKNRILHCPENAEISRKYPLVL